MNRLGLLIFLLGAFIATIFFIRSKRFDNFISKLIRGCDSTTASELKADIKQTEEKKKEIKKNIEIEEKRLQKERNIVGKL
jgi:preprotein translocase subunit YajC